MALGPSTMTLNGKKVQCLPSMTLLSADPMEKVVAFYKQELKDFTFKSEYNGMRNLFWTGRDNLGTGSMADRCETTNEYVSPEKPDVFMPEAKTSIAIIYAPK